VSRSPARIPLWVWWIPVVLIASFPLGPTPVPQWERVHLVPFTDPADKVEDFAVNILLFLPFGFSFARDRGLTWLPLAAGRVSAVAELSQLFSTVRYPSGTDVAYAVVGAAVGGLASAILTRRWR
jgi:glycopeptide antibiotics resistance protein